jgi:hypothetical protein
MRNTQLLEQMRSNYKGIAKDMIIPFQLVIYAIFKAGDPKVRFNVKGSKGTGEIVLDENHVFVADTFAYGLQKVSVDVNNPYDLTKMSTGNSLPMSYIDPTLYSAAEMKALNAFFMGTMKVETQEKNRIFNQFMLPFYKAPEIQFNTLGTNRTVPSGSLLNHLHLGAALKFNGKDTENFVEVNFPALANIAAIEGTVAGEKNAVAMILSGVLVRGGAKSVSEN